MTGLAIGSIIAAAAETYSAVDQHQQAKRTEQAQKEALRKQEEESLKKGSEATAVNAEDSDMEEARKRLLRKGFLGSLKTSETGLGTPAPTAGVGLKSSLG